MARLSDRNKELSLVPVPQSPDGSGLVQSSLDDSVPAGWLEADGSAVSRSEYSELFEKIGTTYGDGDGSTTFNLPPSIVSDVTSREINANFVLGNGSDKKQVLMTDAEITNNSTTTIKAGSVMAVTSMSVSVGSTLTIEPNGKLKQI